MRTDEFLARLNEVKGSDSRGRWTALCPVHGDEHHSLSVRETNDGKILVHCFVGCSVEQIVAVMGLQMSDLWYDDNGSPRQVVVEDLEPPEPEPEADPQPDPAPEPEPGGITPLDWWADYCGVPLDYLKELPLVEDGDQLAFTFAPAKVRKLRKAGTKDVVWAPAKKDTPPWWPVPPNPAPKTIWLTEGESDATVARYVGLPAYAITKGANTAPTPEQAQALKARGVCSVVLLFDIDKTGREGAAKTAAALAQAGIETRVLDLAEAGLLAPLPEPDLLAGGYVEPGPKDLRDLWKQSLDREGLKASLEEAAGAAAVQEAVVPLPRKICLANIEQLQLPTDLEYLPMLGRGGYIVRNWAHLLSGRSKAGKTELAVRWCQAWQGERILYISEESPDLWTQRKQLLHGPWLHLEVYFGLGEAPEKLLAEIEGSDATVVVMDSLRYLLQLRDEKDNSEIARAVTPFVLACRRKRQTLLMTHYPRKSGGDYGEAIAGGTALVAGVDAYLEYWQDDKKMAGNQRLLFGNKRLMPITAVVVQLNGDLSMSVVGTPDAVLLTEQERAVLAALAELGESDFDRLLDFLKMDGVVRSRTQLQRLLQKLTASARIVANEVAGARPNAQKRVYRLAGGPEKGRATGAAEPAPQQTAFTFESEAPVAPEARTAPEEPAAPENQKPEEREEDFSSSSLTAEVEVESEQDADDTMPIADFEIERPCLPDGTLASQALVAVVEGAQCGEWAEAHLAAAYLTTHNLGRHWSQDAGVLLMAARARQLEGCELGVARLRRELAA
ncbi:MAG: AAA family ATPase [Anaerolineae bacterium]